ncbi:MAG: DUF885 domain-containing protein [Gammaproteobacteria bacterium]
MRAIAKILFLSLIAATTAGAAETPAWVKESNEHAMVVLEALVKFSPESASQLGVEGYDDQVADLKPKVYERGRDVSKAVLKDLKARLARTQDATVRQDIEILIQSVEDNQHSNDLQNDMTLPYFAVSRLAFSGIRGLLDPRVSKERQALAVTRLKRYAGLEPKTQPIAELARDRIEEKLSNKKLLRPLKEEVEQNLADTPRLVAGIKDLFEKSGLQGWQEAHAALAGQLEAYDAWVKDVVLPQARTDHRLPPVLYADALKQFGVDVPPEALMQDALVAFNEIQTQMAIVATRVAKEQKLKSSDYRDVIRALKAKQVTGPAILPLFEQRNTALEDIIRREKIVTLPERKAVIRLASEAESAMTPAPNMRPPRLIGNTGEYGEFVLPLVVPGKEGREGLKMDDFTHEAGSWSLTAHEARPGHELQFSAMVEKGISTARAVFAFNSVNVEGWGLYSEAEVQPYLPPEAQLFTLQFRLQRAARAFLDPMVNLGQMAPGQVKSFLMEEVGLSEGMSQQEVDRYTFRAPGQATSYFYGYQRLLETRQRAQIALRDKFDRKAFNDFVLSQGLLPPKLLQKAVMEDFVGKAAPAGAGGSAFLFCCRRISRSRREPPSFFWPSSHSRRFAVLKLAHSVSGLTCWNIGSASWQRCR